MGIRGQAYDLGHLLFKIEHQDAFERGADGPVASDVLADVLESRAEGLAAQLGLKIDIIAIRGSDRPLKWKTRLSGYLKTVHGDDVAAAFELGVWIILYTAVQGGYPIDGQSDQAQKATRLAKDFTACVRAAGLDESTVTPLIEAARRVGIAGSDPSEVGRVGGETAIRLAEAIEAQETDVSGGSAEPGTTAAIPTTINYFYGNAQVAYPIGSVTQTQTLGLSPATTALTESVANVLTLLPHSGLPADDQEDVQAVGQELLAEINQPEQDPKKIKRAFMALKGYFAPIALNVATGAATGAASGAEHAARAAIESMLTVQL